MKLTQAAIAKLMMPAGKSEHIEWDEAMPGFGLRCRAGGKQEHRTFIVQYKIGAKHRRMTLGNAAKINVDTARSKAKQIFGKLVDGADPANERAVARSAAGNTFDVISADFLSVQATRTKASSYEATERYINHHWKPLHSLALGSINRATVAAQLRLIEKEHGAVSADRARAALSKFFAWAMGEGLSEHNPVIGTNKAAGEYQPRERVLADAELAAIIKASPDGDCGRIVRLLMLTGCRRDEIGSLRWSELRDLDDADKARIELPGERTKNSRDHVVPLSGAAVAVLQAIVPRAGRDLVFGEGEGGFSGWSKAKAALDDKLGKAVKHWTLHDLRRTGATRMADSGVQPHIIEAVLNHISGHKAGVAGIYNRATYEPEKRAALDTLASYIKTAVAQAEGGNVHRIRGRR